MQACNKAMLLLQKPVAKEARIDNDYVRKLMTLELRVKGVKTKCQANRSS